MSAPNVDLEAENLANRQISDDDGTYFFFSSVQRSLNCVGVYEKLVVNGPAISKHSAALVASSNPYKRYKTYSSGCASENAISFELAKKSVRGPPLVVFTSMNLTRPSG